MLEEKEIVISLEQDRLDVEIDTEKTAENLEIEGNEKVPIGDNYEKLKNKPKIENIELIGNKTFEELGLQEISNIEIDKLFKQYFD